MRIPFNLTLYMQVLPYSCETSKETDSNTDQKRYRNEVVIDCLNRKEIQKGTEHCKS